MFRFVDGFAITWQRVSLARECRIALPNVMGTCRRMPVENEGATQRQELWRTGASNRGKIGR